MRYSLKATLWICILMLGVFGAQAGEYDPSMDLNQDGCIDGSDLFEGSSQWSGQQTAGFTDDDLLDLFRCWHTSGQVGDLTVSLPERFVVELTGPGGVMGEVNVPVRLNEVNGLTRAELWFPLNPENSSYSIVVGDPNLTALTGSFTLISDATSPDYVNFYRYVIIESDTPLSESGPGDLFSLHVLVTALVPAPHPEDVEVAFGFVPGYSDLQGPGGATLAHTTQDGSLLINPSGGPVPTSTPTPTITPTPGEPTSTPTPTDTGQPTATPTPTETIGGDTPTPTQTQIPSGDASQLQIVFCQQEEFVGNMLTVRVDQLDSEGHIVNPGVEGGDQERQVTVSVNGSATLPSAMSGQNWTTTLDKPGGLVVQIEDTVAEDVTVTASAPGLTNADPVIVSFIEGGNIAGQVQVYDAAQGGLRAAGMGEVFVYVYVPGATDTTTAMITSFDGSYITPYIAAGTYDVSFKPNPYFQDIFHPMADPLKIQTACVSGVIVKTGETTPQNADLPERTGARVFGTVTAKDGIPLVTGTVELWSKNLSPCNSLIQLGVYASVQGNVLAYEFPDIPPDTYYLITNATGNNDKAYTSLDDNTIVVETTDVEKNLEVIQQDIYPITFITPVNYERAVNPPTFEWSVPAEVPAMQYYITLSNRCEGIWKKEGVTQTQVQYDGPALQKNEIYSWGVTGVNNDGSAMATWHFPTSPGDPDNHFIVE